MTKQDEARERVKKLEADPKHKFSKEADDQTRNDNMNDPKFHKGQDNDPIDSKWKKDEQGNWSHPDFE